jgi:hypothetical protein
MYPYGAIEIIIRQLAGKWCQHCRTVPVPSRCPYRACLFPGRVCVSCVLVRTRCRSQCLCQFVPVQCLCRRAYYCLCRSSAIASTYAASACSCARASVPVPLPLPVPVPMHVVVVPLPVAYCLFGEYLLASVACVG